MHLEFRKATKDDLKDVCAIYESTHDREEAGLCHTGWKRGVYPISKTAEIALQKNDLFVAVNQGKIVATARINQEQMDEYKLVDWNDNPLDEQIMVIHTLAVAKEAVGKGCGRQFVSFFEEYARQQNCPFLRMDTNITNIEARSLYQKMGYTEVGCVPCEFNGITGLKLILLEKKLEKDDN